MFQKKLGVADLQRYHLQKAEIACRQALMNLGGGYLFINDPKTNNLDTSNDLINKQSKIKNLLETTGTGKEKETPQTQTQTQTQTQIEMQQSTNDKKARDFLIHENTKIKYDATLVSLHLQLARICFMQGNINIAYIY